MSRPKYTEFKKPEHIKDYPLGPSFNAGHLPEKNAGWRTFKPIFDKDKCIYCLRCYIVCPEGTIYKSENKLDIDYDFCKGCGVCAYECPKDAIEMIKEDK